MATGALVLPDFLIGGAPRSGTTFLAATLDRHPNIKMATPLVPEPKVFMTPAASSDDFLERYRVYFNEDDIEQTRGEKTSYYLESAEACRRIKEALGAIRILFIVREPVARAYSNYLWTKKNGFESLGFEDAVDLEGQRASPLPPGKSYTRVYDYLSRGDYGSFAERYYGAMGRDGVKFVLFEDMVADPERFFEDVLGFIDVPILPPSALATDHFLSARDEGPPIDPGTERRLRARVRPMVEKFHAVTDLDLSRWNY